MFLLFCRWCSITVEITFSTTISSSPRESFSCLTQVRWQAELWQSWQSWCVNKNLVRGGEKEFSFVTLWQCDSVTVWQCDRVSNWHICWPLSDWVLTGGGGREAAQCAVMWCGAHQSRHVPPPDTGHAAQHRQCQQLTWRWLVIARACWRTDSHWQAHHVTLSDNNIVIGPVWWAREEHSPPTSLLLDNVSHRLHQPAEWSCDQYN